MISISQTPAETPVQGPINLAEVQYEGGTNSTTLFLTILMGASLALAFFIAVVYFFLIMPEEQAQTSQAAVAEIVGPAEDYVRDTSDFHQLDLVAKAAVVYDIERNEVVWSKNENESLPLASLTKLMTALVGAETLMPDHEVLITPSSLSANGNSGLRSGETWLFADLLDFTLLTSSNDGAQAIAGAAGAMISRKEGITDKNEPLRRLTFVQEMNTKARDLELTETTFANASGLDVGLSDRASRGSAEDVAKLLAHIFTKYPNILLATKELEMTFQSLDDFEYEARNTNARVGQIPGLIASKTGFTNLAGGNLAIIFDTSFGHPVALVVLGSTFEERFIDIEKLAGATRTYFAGPKR